MKLIRNKVVFNIQDTPVIEAKNEPQLPEEDFEIKVILINKSYSVLKHLSIQAFKYLSIPAFKHLSTEEFNNFRT